MRQRRSHPEATTRWPAALHHLIRAAELECPRGHAAALLDLTALAVRKVPARGVFDPGSARDENNLYAAIEAVADGHLHLTEARAAWRGALDAAKLGFEQRDRLERTALQVQTTSDTAYFYAGLAFGLTLVCVYRSD